MPAIAGLPLPRLQLPLDENLRSLFQILLGDAAQIFIEDDDPVPLGFSLRSPVALSRQDSEATARLASGRRSSRSFRAPDTSGVGFTRPPTY